MKTDAHGKPSFKFAFVTFILKHFFVDLIVLFLSYRDKVERKIQTGRTSYECRRSCYLHCGTNLRKSSPPTGVGLVKGATTGSSISMSWLAPLDTGGR